MSLNHPETIPAIPWSVVKIVFCKTGSRYQKGWGPLHLRHLIIRLCQVLDAPWFVKPLQSSHEADILLYKSNNEKVAK